MVIILSADVVFPVASAPIVGGGVAIEDGRVRAEGTRREMVERYPQADVQHFAGHVLTPGLVNAHTHLELSYMRGRLAPTGRFTEWVSELMRNYPGPEEMAGVISQAARQGMEESVCAGVTSVGDISRQCGTTRVALRSGPLRVVSFGEVVGLGKMRGALDKMLSVAIDRGLESETLRAGVSPHAPYTVETPSLARVAKEARRLGLPVAMHLAELAEEAAFLRDLSGPLGREWDVMLNLDVIDETIPRFADGPIAWAQSCGLLETGTSAVLAHVNYVSDEELTILSSYGASVAYCPRTRAYFGHDRVGPHRFREMLAKGINVCLGTDSLASNPDLVLMREAQFLLRQDSKLSPTVLLEMLTFRGARALGLGDGIGTITPGGMADVAAFAHQAAGGDAPEAILRSVIEESPLPSAVWIGGKKCV